MKARKGIKEQSMAKGFAVLSVASVLVKILSLFFIPIIRSLMGGSAGYQVYYSAYQVFAFVYVLATAGLPVAISKVVTELMTGTDHRQSKRAFRIARMAMLILGSVLTLILLIFAKPIAAATGYEESWLGIAVIAPNILLCSVLSAYRGYLQGLKNMSPTAISQVVEQCVHLFVSIVAVLLLRDKGVVWMVAGASIGTLAGSIVALLVVYYYYRVQCNADQFRTVICSGENRKEEHKQYVRLLIAYSVPITLSAAIQYGGNLIDVFIVKGRLLAAGVQEGIAETLHGDLSAARQLINVPSSLVTALCVSVLPIIAGLYVQNKKKAAASRAEYAFKLCFIVSVPCTVAMCVFAKPIYQLLGFGGHYQMLMYMSFSVLLMGIVHLQSSIMQSVNLLYASAAFMGVSVVVKAILNYVFIGIPGLNIYGAVLSTYISYFVPILLNHQMLIRKRGLKVRILSTAAPSILGSAVMLVPSVPCYILLSKLLGASYAANLFTFVLSAGIAIVTYFAIMVKIGGICKEDVDSISPKISKILRLKDEN